MAQEPKAMRQLRSDTRQLTIASLEVDRDIWKERALIAEAIFRIIFADTPFAKLKMMVILQP